ncbi:MAG: tol-pal system YbgF family protein [Phycisphaerae bacterium]
MYHPKRKRLGAIFIIFFVVDLEADEVKLLGKPTFRDVEVVDFKDGSLVFEGVSRQTLRKPISQIEWFTIDRYPALTNAEQLAAANEWPSAVRSYELAMDRLAEPWLRDWIQLRILRALDGTGAYDDAVSRYIELLSQREDRDVLPPPRNAGPPNSPVNANARLILATALEEPLKNRVRGQLESLLLELVLIDTETQIPRQLKVPEDLLPDRDREGASADANPKKKKRRRYGLLPEYATAAPVTKLPAETILLESIQREVDAGDVEGASVAMSDIRPFLHEHDVPRADVLLARMHLARREFAAALEVLARLTGSTEPHDFRCDALYYSGLAALRLERADLAVEYLTQLRENRTCEGVWADLATQLLAEANQRSKAATGPVDASRDGV